MVSLPRLKICGLRDRNNVRKALMVNPDFLGFIFYPDSPRYVGEDPRWVNELELPSPVTKVGVFVNKGRDRILDICEQAGIRMIQLHGKESPNICYTLKRDGFAVVKMFAVGPGFSYEIMEDYLGKVDYFLFDTKGPQPGGSGRSFTWDFLEHYPFDIPFFLSGGIGLDNITSLKDLNAPRLFAVDVNSRLESATGEKDPGKLKDFRLKFDRIRI